MFEFQVFYCVRNTIYPYTIPYLFQSGQFQYRSILQALVTIYRGEGLKGEFCFDFSGTDSVLHRPSFWQISLYL